MRLSEAEYAELLSKRSTNAETVSAARPKSTVGVNHKFHAVPTTNDGIRFDSKREAKYYQTLKSRVQAGDVVMFLRQVPMHLPAGVKYVCDFVEFWADGTVHFVDVKGVKTPMFNVKRKQVEALYPVKIELV